MHPGRGQSVLFLRKAKKGVNGMVLVEQSCLEYTPNTHMGMVLPVFVNEWNAQNSTLFVVSGTLSANSQNFLALSICINLISII